MTQVGSAPSETRAAYLTTAAVELARGDVDDVGDARYQRLSQNVPDHFVFELQRDLTMLGLDVGAPDGAFGRQTRRGVKALQATAGLPETGIVDAATKAHILDRLEAIDAPDAPVNLPPDAELRPTPPDIRLLEPLVPHFSQGDPQWASRTLGRGSTMQRQGCAICCIAMVLSFYDRPATPATLDGYLDANDGYAGDSVKWNVAGQFGSGEAVEPLRYSRVTGSEAEVTTALFTRLDEGKPSLVRVDYNIDGDLAYNHFVVAVGQGPAGEIIMNDPATRYGDGYQRTQQNILQQTDRKGGYRIVQADWYDA